MHLSLLTRTSSVLSTARTMLTALLSAGALLSSLSAHAAQGIEVPVANFTPFNELPSYIQANLSEPLKAEIRARKLAVFAISSTYAGLKTCYAALGLTHAPANGKSPRWPPFTVDFFSAKSPNWDEANCEPERLRAAVDHFNTVPLQELLTNIERTRDDGQPKNEKLVPDAVLLKSIDLSDATMDEATSLLHRFGLSKAFDHRHVQTFVVGRSVNLEEGRIVCLAFAGISARSPDGRSSRVPTSYESFARVQDGGDVQGCYRVVVAQAVEALMKRPWNAKGLLEKFEVTREAGVPLPNPKQAQRAQAAWLKAQESASPKQQLARTTSVNRLTCTNQCSNGNCERTFANGRKERWIAPRVYNPFTNNWEFDITTNACGG